MKDVLVIVDMQQDFVTGALGTAEARAIIPAVAEKIRSAQAAGMEVVYTMDTHDESYSATEEGKNLPVPHCIKDRDGWQLIPELRELLSGCRCFEKPGFGSTALADYLSDGVERIELVGVCTGICVISNAVAIKAKNLYTHVVVDGRCCACVTPESHQTALDAMKTLQIEVIS